jgi:hypothetical protein
LNSSLSHGHTIVRNRYFNLTVICNSLKLYQPSTVGEFNRLGVNYAI